MKVKIDQVINEHNPKII